jgi:heptosyltransferase-2
MRLLVIRFSSLGDCTLLCPFLDHVKQHGATEVTVVTKQVYAELFSAATGVDRIVALDTRGGWRALRQVIDACGETEVVIDAHNTIRSRIVARGLGGADARFEKHYRQRLGLIWLKRPADIPTISQCYSNLGEAVGFPPMTRAAGGLEIPAPVRTRVAALLDHIDGDYLAIAPGSRWAMKRWGADKFLQLVQHVAREYGYHVVLVGDKSDAPLTGDIASALGSGVTDLAGRTSVLESAAAIRRAVAFVGNDSGLMHLAEAVGVPVVALFGPTVQAFGYYPSLPSSRVIARDLACRPCSRNGSRFCPKGTQECMTEIRLAPVIEALNEIVTARSNRRVVN